MPRSRGGREVSVSLRLDAQEAAGAGGTQPADRHRGPFETWRKLFVRDAESSKRKPGGLFHLEAGLTMTGVFFVFANLNRKP